jgi:recyclin-1
LRGSVIRENDKTNFLASFKKVILLPVSVLPTLPFPGTHSRTQTQHGKVSTPQLSSTPARPSTPSDWEDTPAQTSSAQPTSDLAAQTAILNSRLERIKTLFSIEVALQLIHMGKESLERMKTFKHLHGEIGEKVYFPSSSSSPAPLAF